MIIKSIHDITFLGQGFEYCFASELHLNFWNENEFYIKYMWNYLLNTAIKRRIAYLMILLLDK